MAKTEDIVVPVVCIFIILILACVQIPLTGFGPLWAKKLWTKIIRMWKKGDKRPWDWTAVEEGVIYLSTLPRSAAELQELQVRSLPARTNPRAFPLPLVLLLAVRLTAVWARNVFRGTDRYSTLRVHPTTSERLCLSTKDGR